MIGPCRPRSWTLAPKRNHSPGDSEEASCPSVIESPRTSPSSGSELEPDASKEVLALRRQVHDLTRALKIMMSRHEWLASLMKNHQPMKNGPSDSMISKYKQQELLPEENPCSHEIQEVRFKPQI